MSAFNLQKNFKNSREPKLLLFLPAGNAEKYSTQQSLGKVIFNLKCAYAFHNVHEINFDRKI